jgi:8-oxo-dGTP pyrophosphatase MutT (NUDIX family)
VLLLRGIFEPLKLPIDANTLSVLMVRRKDSMSYMEFVRGKYDTVNLDLVNRLILNMTAAEQDSIINNDFETLWTNLWGNGRDFKSTEYENAKSKFESLDILNIVSNFHSPYNEPEWGFPKGRRGRGESDLECAVREFNEETNISPEAYTILPDMILTETFTGTNGINYRHTYFVALLKDSRTIDTNQKLTLVQRREISAVGWKTLAECSKITRPHYAERRQMIEELKEQVGATISKSL